MTGERLPAGVVRIRADNPGPFSLDGTNTYVIERRWVVDPGPALDAHVDAVTAALDGLEAMVLTHSHADHAGAVPALAARFGTGEAIAPGDGEQVGPLVAVASPGHSRDHVCLVSGRTCFTGDAVLGTGSVFIQPGGGGLGAYLDALGRLRELDLDCLCPGHGPVVWDAHAKLDEYIEHRLEREAMLRAALDRGLRTTGELLDAAWADAPRALRPAAALTLAAHLEKLDDDGRLPAGVEDPFAAFPELAAFRDA